MQREWKANSHNIASGFVHVQLLAPRQVPAVELGPNIFAEGRNEMENPVKTNRDQILRLARRHGVTSVRVFGSMARGDAGPKSDVDLLVDVGSDPSRWFPGGLVAELEELLGRRVQVITERGLDELLRDRVLAEAVPL